MTLCGEKFYALDEILGSFCGPFSSFIEDVTSHEKYHTGITAEELEARLLSSASENTRLIRWGICADKANESRYIRNAHRVSQRASRNSVLLLVGNPMSGFNWS